MITSDPPAYEWRRLAQHFLAGRSKFARPSWPRRTSACCGTSSSSVWALWSSHRRESTQISGALFGELCRTADATKTCVSPTCCKNATTRSNTTPSTATATRRHPRYAEQRDPSSGSTTPATASISASTDHGLERTLLAPRDDQARLRLGRTPRTCAPGRRQTSRNDQRRRDETSLVSRLWWH